MSNRARTPDLARKRQITRIHVAKAQLGLDDATYRALLLRVGGHESSAQMTNAQRAAVIAELIRLGFKEERRAAAKRRWPGEPKDCDSKPMLRKVRALLADAKRPWSYAHAMAKHMFGSARVEWLPDDQLHKLIAALQVDARRHGRNQ